MENQFNLHDKLSTLLEDNKELVNEIGAFVECFCKAVRAFEKLQQDYKSNTEFRKKFKAFKAASTVIFGDFSAMKLDKKTKKKIKSFIDEL